MAEIVGLFFRGDACKEGLLSELYAELRMLAQSHMNRAGVGHSFQATTLVHDLWAKLVGLERMPKWPSRAHFFKWCSTVMGNLLRDHLRQQRTQKSGGGLRKVALESRDFVARSHSIEGVIDILDAIEGLSKVDPKLGAVVELRAVVGLSYREIASTLGLSEAQVDRSLQVARARLRVRLQLGG